MPGSSKGKSKRGGRELNRQDKRWACMYEDAISRRQAKMKKTKHIMVYRH
jgi:hypothetical protein